ncbi:MAG: hypothetical protein P8X57_13465 [Cyclobacteriaceae bacterium]
MKHISIYIILLTLFLASCYKKGPYREMLDDELASGVRNDSLFLGFHFGMPRKEFYASCWQMNKEGLLIQGPNNLSVQYSLDDELSMPAFMRFYPSFDDNGNIYSMPMEFIFENYAPWNTSTSSDSLILEVKDLFESWYGPGFIKLEDEEGARTVYVKIDGNRRIRLFKRDVSFVAADITDMTSEEMNKGEDEG